MLYSNIQGNYARLDSNTEYQIPVILFILYYILYCTVLYYTGESYCAVLYLGKYVKSDTNTQYQTTTSLAILYYTVVYY